jgi:hypothetical protein
MRHNSILVGITALVLSACGSSDHTGGTEPSKSPGTPADKTPDDSVSQAGAFSPPAAPDGYTRLTAATVKDVLPGTDVTYCQYVMAPNDHDVDILDVSGYQSAFGHHAVAFSYTASADTTLGTSFPCMGTEFSSGDGTSATSAGDANLASMGSFLGGIGGAKGGKSAPLPDGVAFRLKKGDGIMLNVHYLNTGETPVDGDAVVDVKFAEADPNRMIASLFLNLNFGFDLAPNATTSSSVECVAGDDVKILMMSNHMHEFGTTATTEVVRADGTNDMLHHDPSWTYEMQFNPVYSTWTAEDPFVLHTGDTIRTTCQWNNTKSDSMKFPREMCIGVGFALTTGGSTKVPACAGGTWLSSFL